MKVLTLLQIILIISGFSKDANETAPKKDSVVALSSDASLLFVAKNEPDTGYHLQAFRLNQAQNGYSLTMNRFIAGGKADRIVIHKNCCLVTSSEEFGEDNSVTLARILDLNKDGFPEVKVFSSGKDVDSPSWRKIPRVLGDVLWNVLEPRIAEDSVIFTGHPIRIGVDEPVRPIIIINCAKMTLEIQVE